MQLRFSVCKQIFGAIFEQMLLAMACFAVTENRFVVVRRRSSQLISYIKFVPPPGPVCPMGWDKQAQGVGQMMDR